jgi:hypothetical protein
VCGCMTRQSGTGFVRPVKRAGNAPTAAERAETRELKAELERLTRERDLLGSY